MTVAALPINSKIYIAGHSGLAGSAIWRHFSTLGYRNLYGWRSSEIDLRERRPIADALVELRPDCVILAAAKVGGIAANDSYPVEFLIENTAIQNNVMAAAHVADVSRLVFLGSSCIYPKFAEQPIREDSLMTGALEPTNDAYAVAKIAGIKLVQSYRKQYGRKWISVMPANLYGLGDNYNLESSHVLAALVRRFTDAVKSGSKTITLWGSGNPRREFLHSDDLATAVVMLINKYDSDTPINIGYGSDISIRELAIKIAQITGFIGEILWDQSKPDGTPRKLLDISSISLMGWRPKISLDQGLERVCAEYAAMNLLD
ncbi:MAG TPA: GDP-L-fucose synthase [Candidatus Nanopelagicaceae bacterium]